MRGSVNLGAIQARHVLSIAALAVVISGALALAGGVESGVERTVESQVSPTSEGVDATAPWGVHLSFTKDSSTTMTVTWFTNGTEDPGTTVRYGSSPDALTETATGTTHSAPLDSKLLVHEATMTDLSPGETVYYQVGGDSGFSKVYETQTIPENGSFRIAVYGDQGVDQGALDVHELVKGANPDLVLIAGDLSYAEGDADQWAEWFAMNEDLFARVPMMSSPGNHEAYSSAGMKPYKARVAQPGAEYFYSFDVGNVHVLVMNSQLSSAREQGNLDEMIAFAERDLQEAFQAKQAGEIDHVFALQHHMLYSNTAFVTRVAHELAAVEEQWFHRYDVKFLFTGHNHNYERSYPMAYQAPTTFESTGYEDPAGWIQVITGGGGDGKYPCRHPGERLPWSVTCRSAYHFTQVDVDGETVSVEAIKARLPRGATIDEFTLTDTDDLVRPAEAEGTEPPKAFSQP